MPLRILRLIFDAHGMDIAELDRRSDLYRDPADFDNKLLNELHSIIKENCEPRRRHRAEFCRPKDCFGTAGPFFYARSA
jgi:hypothetical protein